MHKIMKCDYNSSEMTMGTEGSTHKLRCFTLFINTADLINEATTPTLAVGHAVAAPVSIITTYIFIGSLVLGAMKDRYASPFLQSYALVSCASAASFLFLSVCMETDLKSISQNQNAATVLNSLLPLLIIFLLLADLVIVLFIVRDPTLSIPGSAPTQPNMSINTM